MRLHLVDGTFELFRAHFSKRPSRTSPDGRDVKATVGVVSSLLALLDDGEEAVTHIGVAFDNPIRSFRNELFAGYKDETGVPPELLAQFDAVEEAVAALGVTVWSMEEFEADDALATAALRWAPDVDQVRILTPDKDLGQCVSGTHVVQVDRMRGNVIDEEALRLRRGVGPSSIPDLLALVGDTADGIPGIPGFGEKTAAALLGCYEHIEHIPADASEWDVAVRGATRLAGVLAGAREDALFYRRLATLVSDVPLAGSLEDLRWPGTPGSVFERWADGIGATFLLDRPGSGEPAR